MSVRTNPSRLLAAAFASFSTVACGSGPATCNSREPQFARGDAVHVVVAEFAGLDQALADEARERMIAQLEDFDAKGDRLEIVSVTDTLRKHRDAKSCANNLKADAVIWGTADQNAPSNAGSNFTLKPRVTLLLGGQWVQHTGQLDMHSLGDIDLERTTRQGPTFLVPFLIGVNALKRGRVAESLESFTASLETTSPNDRARLAVFPAVANLATGNYSKAAQVLDSADTGAGALSDADKKRYYLLRGIAREHQSLPKGLNDYQEVLRLSASNALVGDVANARLGIASTFLRQGQFDAVLKTVDPALANQCQPREEYPYECTLNRLALLEVKVLAIAFLGRMEEAKTLMKSTVAANEALLDRLNQEAKSKRGVDKPFVRMLRSSDGYEPAKLQPAQLWFLRKSNAMCSSLVPLHPELSTILFPNEKPEDYPRIHEHALRMLDQNSDLKKLEGIPTVDYVVRCQRVAFNAGATKYRAAEIASGELKEYLDKHGDSKLLRLENTLWRAYLRDMQGHCTEARDMVRAYLPDLGELLGSSAPVLNEWRKYANGEPAPWRVPGKAMAACSE